MAGTGRRAMLKHRASAACLCYATVISVAALTLLAWRPGGTADCRALVTERWLQSLRSGAGAGKPKPVLHISGTDLHGPAATAFRHKLSCFSNSGKWVYDAQPKHITPSLFGGHWLGHVTRGFRNATPGAVFGERANRVAATGPPADWIVREDLKWEWQTDEKACHRPDFCRRLGRKGNMLVVGDSINQELFWILMNHLVVNKTRWKYVPMGPRQGYTQGEVEPCQDVLGGQGIRVGFVRNDRLSLIQRVNQDSKNNFMEYPWINFVESWNISVLVLDTESHFESDANFTESLTNTFSVIKKRWPQALVFFRNAPPGTHCKPHQLHGPQRALEALETLNEYARGYHWAEFARQNEIAKNITHRFGFIYMDPDALIALRPEGTLHHKASDCLHYCVPGPLDVFAKLLYNTMLLLHPLPIDKS